MGSKKVVMILDLHDNKDKQKAMKVVSKIPRIDSIAMDMKDMKLTVIGDIDPITVVNKLRRYWSTDIAFVGPAKEPEKKKDGDNKQKDGGGGGGGGGGGDPNNKKKDGDGKKEGGSDSKDKDGGKKKDYNPIPAPVPVYNPYVMPYYPHNVTYNPYMNYPQHVNSQYPPPMPASASYGYVHEENPNGCVIC